MRHYDENMDIECIPLCDALNALPGITTTESCCGHGKEPFRIWFRANSLGDLPALAYRFSPCHSGCYGWKITMHTDCSMSPVQFLIEHPLSDTCYEEANKIAALILEDIKNETAHIQEIST